MSRGKHKVFSSAREVFKTYLPKSMQEGKMNSGHGEIEDSRTSDLVDVFKSNLKRQTRRQTS